MGALRKRGVVSEEVDVLNKEKSTYDNEKKKSKRTARKLAKAGLCARFCSTLLFLFKVQLTISFFIGLVILAIMVLPNDFNASKYRLAAIPGFSDKLNPNTKLSQAEHLYEDEIIGPEAFAYHNHKLYTGLADGRIVELEKQKVVREIRTNPDADPIKCKGMPSYWDSPECGRPLGIRWDKEDNELVVADAYFGLIRIDMDMGTVIPLLENISVSDGPPVKFINDLALMSDGTILFSDSSAKYKHRDYMKVALEANRDGRLLKFDPHIDEITTLMKGLVFANGVELNPDESFVYVAESGMARIWIHHLTGEKNGKSEIWKDNLPGLPDNIRLQHGLLYVPMTRVRNNERLDLTLYDWLGTKTTLRNAIGRLIPDSWLPLIDRYFGSKYGLVCIYNVHSRDMILSLHDPTGRFVPKVSQFFEAEDAKGIVQSYIGSYNSPYLAHIESKLPPNNKKTV